MELTRKSLISLLVAGAVMIGFLMFSVISDKANTAYASVAIGNEYKATTTDATWSTATTQCKDTLTGSKTLGSIIVTKTSNAVINIYDATTTASHSNHATTTIASFPLTTVGTYTFDVTATRGLCVVVDTTVGVASSTITTRP